MFVPKWVKYTPALSNQSNIELYPVKTFLDQVEIGRYLPTYLDGKIIIQINKGWYAIKQRNQTNQINI